MASPGVQTIGRRAEHSAWFEWLTRAGFFARGVIYGIIGLLAVQVAIHSGGKVTDQRGALTTIAHQPFGHGLVLAIAVGLGGYAAWRFVQAIHGRGPEGGGDASATGRVVAAGSGIAYAGVCALAVSVLLQSGSSSSSSPHR